MKRRKAQKGKGKRRKATDFYIGIFFSTNITILIRYVKLRHAHKSAQTFIYFNL